MRKLRPVAFRSAVPEPKPVLITDSIPPDLLTQWGTRLYE